MFYPLSEAVAVTWLRSIFTAPVPGVSTSLPGDVASWAAQGFIQVGSLGGPPMIDVPVHQPVLSIDCWAANRGSQKPPWGKAGNLANQILEKSYNFSTRRVIVRDGFYPVRILAVWPETEPRRIPGDDAGFARLQFDLTMRWVIVP